MVNNFRLTILFCKKKARASSLLFLLLLGGFLSINLPVHAIGTRGVLSGKVTDKDTGKSIENVFITVKSPDTTLTTTTDSKGFFSVAGIPAGNYDVRLERVGYQTAAYAGVLVTSDATTSLEFMLVTQTTQVQGVTVTVPRYPVTNPRQTMTNYGYSDKDIQKLFPGPAGLSLTTLYESLPGVQIGYDAYYGAASAHIRGGTGSDVAYAFDGVPTYEPITNTFGTNLTYMGTSRTDFYVGGYPAQYGNFLSGFVNQVVPRGSGQMHANLEFQYGFWVDSANKLPSYAANGIIPTYNGTAAQTPTNINLEISGQEKRLHYYFNHVHQYGGIVNYAQNLDLRPIVQDNGEITNGQQTQDTVLNLNYDLDNSNELQLLFYTGIQKLAMAGFQELPCNPSDIVFGTNCQGSSTATGFGETFNANVIAPLPDAGEIASYDLEKLEWSHRFDAPGELINLRFWRYSPNVFFDIFTPPSSFWEFRRAQENGIMSEYQDQLSSSHLLDTGASFLYSQNYLLSANNNYGEPTATSNSIFASGNQLLYNPSLAGLGTLNTQAVPDTQTVNAWASDEWRPTDDWDIYAGLRFDQQRYLMLPGVNANAFAINLPGYTNGSTFDRSLTSPSFLSPRIGASYKLSDKWTMKSSYGKFVTFAPDRRIERITGTADSSGTAFNQGVSSFASGFTPPTGTTTIPFGTGCPDANGCYQFPSGTAEMLSGAKPQIGETIDVSWEYQLDNNSYLKVTPYIKHIKDPLQSVTVSGIPLFTNAGQISSKGVEFYLKSQDWHGLSGWLSYTYSFTYGSQLPFEGDLLSSAPSGCSPASGCSATGPFSLAQAVQYASQVVPTSYDQRHLVNLSVNYKLGDKWEIAPQIVYGSGYPYGLGQANLQALAALQDSQSFLYGGSHTLAQSVAATPNFNPLGETTYNSLRHPGWWLGNLAVTYHVNKDMDAIFNAFNIFNSTQVLQTDNTVLGGIGYAQLTNPNNPSLGPCCYTSADTTQNIQPYNPLHGQYAPIGTLNLREFWLTLRYSFH